MPAAAPELSPEQRLAQLFEAKGEGAMDGNTDLETRMADPAGDTQNTGQVEPDSSEPDAEDEEQPSAGASDEAVSEDEESESTESDEQVEASQSDGIEVATLASVLGVEENVIQVDEEGQPAFSVTIDGRDSSVPLPELLKSYQQEGAFTRRSQELSHERQTFEQQKQQELQTLTLRAQAVDQVLQEHQQEILAQYDKEDWDTLRQTRPDEFAARRTEYAELYQKMEQRRQAAQNTVAELHQKERQRYDEWRQQTALNEGRELRKKVTEWDTDEKASQGAKAIHDFLLNTYGFTEQDLADTLNHRAYLVAMDAMRYRLQQKQVEPVRKRIVKAPRVMKPGTPSTEGDRRRVQAARVTNRHRKEKSVASAAEAFLAKNIV